MKANHILNNTGQGQQLPTPQSTWEERFKESFLDTDGDWHKADPLQVLHFIRTEIQKAEERGRESCTKWHIEFDGKEVEFSDAVKEAVLAERTALRKAIKNLDFRLEDKVEYSQLVRNCAEVMVKNMKEGLLKNIQD
jgi:hypothetical protein